MSAFWRGFNIVEFVTCAALATAVGFAFLPQYIESKERARMARVGSSMVRTAEALAAFHIDHGRYPPSARAGSVLTSNALLPAGEGSRDLMTFRLPRAENGERFATLTSPVAYLQKLPVDPFARTRSSTLGYFAPESGNGWMLFSLGPDRDENSLQGPGDISPRVEILYDPDDNLPGVWQLTTSLLDVTYDPTNGTFSNGDLWRVKGM